MSVTTFTPLLNDKTIFGMSVRNREAEKTIARYASNHRWLDVAVGAAGVVIPGGSFPAMLACIAAQGPLFYKPMAKELSQIYVGSVDFHTKRIVSEAMFEGAMFDLGNEFTGEFLAEIASELISEMGWGMAASFIPIFGGLAGAALDVLVAMTMTWRVGTMISVYYQNGGNWLGSRRDTFEVAKDFVGPLSIKNANRVNLDELAQKKPRHFKAATSNTEDRFTRPATRCVHNF